MQRRLVPPFRFSAIVRVDGNPRDENPRNKCYAVGLRREHQRRRQRRGRALAHGWPRRTNARDAERSFSRTYVTIP